MGWFEDVMSGVQDDATRQALKNLPESALKALESKALTADAQAKLSKLGDAERELEDFRAKNRDWAAFKAQWEGDSTKPGLKAKAEKALEYEREVARLTAEVNKLKPEAARAEVLAKQAEEGIVDPDKIAALVEQRLSSRIPTPEQIQQAIDARVAPALQQTRDQINTGSIPFGMKLIETSVKARHEYGLDLPTEVISERVRQLGGPDRLEQAYLDLTAAKRQEMAAAREAEREAKYKADVEAALARGREEGRRAVETGMTPEDAGSGFGVANLLAEETVKAGVDPTKYDPSQGTLAREAYKKYQALQQGGKLSDLV